MDTSLQPDTGSSGSSLGDGQDIHVSSFIGLPDVDHLGELVGLGQGIQELRTVKGLGTFHIEMVNKYHI